MIRFFKKPEDPIQQRYIAATRRKRPKKAPVQEIRFVAIDVETSGLKLGVDRILSIALFEMVNGQIDMTRSRSWMVSQPVTAPTAATAIHGILPSETCKGTPEEEMLAELIPLLAGAIVVGHHILFDAAMLNEAMVRNFKIRFLNQVVDTARMAMAEMIPFHRTGYGRQRPPVLEEVCAQLDLPVIARHTAEGDAFTTAEVFLILLGKIRRRLGNRRLNRRPVQLRDLPVENLKPNR
jgi:DNA polymerase-3 subunit epsilon